MSVTAGGFLEGPNQRMAVHTSPVKTAADLGLMALVAQPAPANASATAVPAVRRLMDVADVVEGSRRRLAMASSTADQACS